MQYLGRIENAVGKTVRATADGGDVFAILFTDETVLALRGEIDYESTVEWCCVGTLDDYVLWELGVIDDAEWKRRLEDKAKRKDDTERAEYERLKAKFGCSPAPDQAQ